MTASCRPPYGMLSSSSPSARDNHSKDTKTDETLHVRIEETGFVSIAAAAILNSLFFVYFVYFVVIHLSGDLFISDPGQYASHIGKHVNSRGGREPGGGTCF